MAPKRTARHDPNEVQELLDKAKQGDIEARNELVFRYQPLLASLVHLCLTGNVNPRSRQVQFLKLFARESTPLKNTAHKIKSQLMTYTAEELFHTGQVAAYEAIERCNKGYTSTVVIVFHEMIKDLINDIKPQDLDETRMLLMPAESFEEDLELEMFMLSLDDDSLEWVLEVLESEGKKFPSSKPPPGLMESFVEYLGFDPSI